VPSSARPNIVTASQQAAIVSQRRRQLHRRLRRMGGVLGALLHRRSSGGRPTAQGQQGTGHRPRGLTRQPSAYDAAAAGGHRRAMLSKKYSYIPDTFTSLDQV